MNKRFLIITLTFALILALCGLGAAAESQPDLKVSARQAGRIEQGQDGAVYGDYLFRFTANGGCYVYNLADFAGESMKKVKPLSSFILDRSKEIVPHANSVCFGAAFYEEGDEFPLLYANIYNNYSSEADKLLGMCCVYRLTRDGKKFSTTLVQIIRIGFIDEGDLWISRNAEGSSVPYGNFAVDPQNNLLTAFVMRMGDQTTRYFTFRLPEGSEGEEHPTLGVKSVTLAVDDIVSQFDGSFSHYIQGACVRGGKLYSVEGLGLNNQKAGMRVVDLMAGQELYYLDFMSNGMPIEPELIDFTDDGAIYADYSGNVYVLDIDALEAETLQSAVE